MLASSRAVSAAPASNPTSVSPLATHALAEPLPDLAFRGTLSPAAEFLLLGARTRLEGARRARWEKLLHADAEGEGEGETEGAPLDWDEVLRLANTHRVLGLLGRHLSARSWKGVPAPIAASIQHYFVKVTAHSNALKTELARVSHLLEAAGIAVVSFKGPTLGLMAYGNTVVRPSADLDLLVARDQVARARALLERAGYTTEVAISAQQAQIALRVDSVINFHRPAPTPLRNVLPQGYAVELHWAITSPCLPFDLEFPTVAPSLSWIELPGVPAQTITADAPGAGAPGAGGPGAGGPGAGGPGAGGPGAGGPGAGGPGAGGPGAGGAAAPASWFAVRALAPEDLLLILLVHGAKHLWERLIWLCDLAELLAVSPDLDWPRVLEAAHQRGVQRMTALGLALARDVLGVSLPRPVEEWLSTQPQALRLAAQLRRQLLARAPQSAANQGNLAGHVAAADALLMQTIDTRLHRLGFLWHLATAPPLKERATLDLPQSLDFLWCVLRPARALQRRLSAKPRAG